MENLIALVDTDLRVMSCMFDSKTQLGLSKAKGITVEEIKSRYNGEISTSMIRYSIKKLLSHQYIGTGVSKGRNKTYHITQLGLNYIKDIKQPTIEIIR